MAKSTVEIFNIRLRQIMKSCKFKNTDIAEAMGKDNQTIWNYFHGVTKPTWADTCNLIDYLQRRIGNIDLNFLFGNYDDNDLLCRIKKLQKEVSAIKSAYDNLAIKYALLNDKIKNKIRKEEVDRVCLWMKMNF